MDKRKKYVSPRLEVIDIGLTLLQVASLDGFNMVTPPGVTGPDFFEDTELDPEEAL